MNIVNIVSTFVHIFITFTFQHIVEKSQFSALSHSDLRKHLVSHTALYVKGGTWIEKMQKVGKSKPRILFQINH